MLDKLSSLRAALATSAIATLTLLANSSHAAAQGACPLQRFSLSPSGAQLSGSSGPAAISADGRFVALTSSDGSLIPGDTLGFPDAFVLDTSTGAWDLASVGLGGALGNGASYPSSISDDGRLVAFSSFASNLSAGDSPGTSDIFVRDRALGTTRRFTSTPFTDIGSYYPGDAALSGDGRFLALRGYRLLGEVSNSQQAYRVDLATNVMTRVSSDAAGQPVDGGCARTSLSYDGRFVVFVSGATNLVGGDTNGQGDVFMRDMLTGAIERVNVGPGGAQSVSSASFASAEWPVVSADGRFVAFVDPATNWGLGTPSPLGALYVRDRLLGVTRLASPSTNGAALDSSFSGVALSRDGLTVAFGSLASNLVPGDTNGKTDVFVRNLATGVTTLVSRTPSGALANSHSSSPRLSADGRRVVFSSTATDLVAGDTNAASDAFLRDCQPIVATYCTAQTSSIGCTPTLRASGLPSATSNAPFDVSAFNLLNQRAGLLFYGYTPAAAPYLGGVLCVQPPTLRTALQFSNGAASGVDCSGSFHYDFNARIRSGVDASLVAGSVVYGQYWSRDPFATPATNLTDALRFLVAP